MKTQATAKRRKTNSIEVTDAQSAARAAISRIVLSADSGFSKADKDDILQYTWIAAHSAGETFDRKGLDSTKSGRNGYMVQAARFASYDWLEKKKIRRGRESLVYDLHEDISGYETSEYHNVEKELTLDKVRQEAKEVLPANYSHIVLSLLDPRSEANLSGHPLRTLAAELNLTRRNVYLIFDSCCLFFQGRNYTEAA